MPTLDFDTFLLDVPPQQRPFIDTLHAYLTGEGCRVQVKPAKSGPVVSYLHPETGHTIANFVFRKKGIIMRVYADHVAQYQAFLETMPEGMIKTVEKAPVCRRLLDPTKCSSACSMGNVFTLRGAEYKKCRFSNFMLLIDEESTPVLLDMLALELKERAS